MTIVDDQPKMIHRYTSEMVDIAMRVWMCSSISLIDIRDKRVGRDNPLENYILPTSSFIYTYGSPASLLLNKEPYQTGQYGLCHAGKGTVLTLVPIEEEVQMLMILYKVEDASLYKRHLRRLLEIINPFTQLYGFTPANPLFYMKTMKTMIDNWNKKESMDHFYAKALFYQVIHQIFAELKNGSVRYIEPDYVGWTREYLDKHYHEPISIQEISAMLPMHRSVLARSFRKRLNITMQEYLIRRRIETAQVYLMETNASIQEIAFGSGFTDEFNMIRMFKRYMRMSPSEYRHKRSTQSLRNDIDNNYHSLYNEEELGNLVRPYRDGAYTMLGKTRSKQMIIAVAMSVMLLLTACGTNATTENRNTNVTNSPSQTNSASQQAGEAEKRMIKAANGEIEVPSNPQRLVVSGFAYGDIIPFGLTDKELILEGWVDLENKSEAWRAYWADATANTTRFDTFEDLEGIMQLNPDMIIGTTGQLSSDSEKDLQKITSTILYDQENIDREHYTMGDRMQFLGELFDMEDKAKQLVDEFNEKADEAVQILTDHGLIDKKIVFVHGLENGMPIIATDINQSLTYKIFGMSAPDKVDQEILFHDDLPADLFNNHVKILSMEVLPAYIEDADIIVYRTVEEDEQTTAAKLRDIPVWANIQAVKNGDVLYVPFTDPMFGFSYADYLVAVDTYVEKLKQLPIAQP